MSKIINIFTLIIIFILFIVIFLFTDIEPIFDITDLNILIICILSFSIFCLFLENVIKSYNGQLLLSDKSLFYTLFYYVNNLLLYFLAIWGIFYSHPISPLNISNIDLNVFNIFNLYLCNVFFNYFFLLLLITLFFFQNYTCFIFSVKKIMLFVIIVLCITYNLVLTVFDALTTNTTSSNNIDWFGFLFNSKYSNTYSNKYNINFEWHKATNNIQNTGLYNSMSLFGIIFLILFILIFFIILYINFSVIYINGLTYKSSNFFIKFIQSFIWIIFVYIFIIILFLLIYYIISIYTLNNKF